MRTTIRMARALGGALALALLWTQAAAAGPAPVPPPKQTPAQTAGQTSAPAQAQTAAQTPTAAQAPKQAPAQAPKQTPAQAPKQAPPRASSAKADSGFTLRGGTEGTDFRTLTIEGEDRVHVDFDRPPIAMTLDPAQVPGLELGSAQDVLDRTMPDMVTPYTNLSRTEHSPYLARPWLHEFATGSVARFQPEVKDVERWKLIVANSRGETVATYQGRGDPPKEIAWDGKAQNGTPVVPGLTYSYAFEAYDRAGNKRNFVGQGFTVSAYRINGPAGPTLLFSAKDLSDAKTAPIVLEAASAWNQVNRPRDPIRILASARTRDEANSLASRVTAVFTANVLGDPARIQTAAEVRPDAPVGGVVQIAPAR